MSHNRSVKEVASYVKDQFKLELELNDVIRNCAEALKLLGVFATGRELTITRIADYCVKLPGAKRIESVTRMEAPALSTNITIQDIYFPPQIVFEMPDVPTESETVVYEDNYIPVTSGPYINFEWDCPHVRFNENDIEVAIVSISVKKDAEGYPVVPDATFYACAYYCAYTYQLPLLILGKIQPATFAKLEELKNIKFAQARASMAIEGLSKNELDNLFNIMTSMDRKAYYVPA